MRVRDYQPKAIRIRTWTDPDGYQWVRVDDYGMGMDESLILDYLLRVGASYYRSQRFKAELLRYQTPGQAEFVPISRFGIGLLSCFIVGDRIEVSTWRAQPDSGGPLRLSIGGLRSFFTLYLKDQLHEPPSMPNEARKAELFRTEAGTSIAVRLNPVLDHSRFDVAATLQKVLLHSPVLVEFDGQPVGGDFERILMKPWLQQAIDVPLTAEEMRKVEAVFGIVFKEPIRVRILPLDLTRHSTSPHLKGQALLGLLAVGEEDNAAVRSEGRSVERKYTFRFELSKEDAEQLVASFTYKDVTKLERVGIRHDYEVDRVLSDLASQWEGLAYQFNMTLVREHRAGGFGFDGWEVRELFGQFDMPADETERRWREIRDRLQGPASSARQAIQAARRHLEGAEAGKGAAGQHDAFELATRMYRGTDDRPLAQAFLDAVERLEASAQDAGEKRAEFERLASAHEASLTSGGREVDPIEDWLRQAEAVVNRTVALKRALSDARRAVDIDLRRVLTAELLPARSDVLSQTDRWLSHNGIHVPTKQGYNTKLALKSPAGNGWMFSQLALQDALRPDLSLSRDELRGLPWDAYCQITLALSHALRSQLGDRFEYDQDFLEDALPKHGFFLENVIRNTKPGLMDVWIDEPIILTDDGKLSVREIRERVSRGAPVTIKASLPSMASEHFHSFLVATLIQLGLRVVVMVKEKKMVVESADPPMIADGQMQFPPLFFSDYRSGEKETLRLSTFPLNRNHPFSGWLIDCAATIQRHHPGLFDSLRSNLGTARYLLLLGGQERAEFVECD